MRIKRYEGEERDLPRIIRQVRRDLGENAVVKTRRFKKGGLLGVGGKSMVEVYAGIERDIRTEMNGSAQVSRANREQIIDQLLPSVLPDGMSQVDSSSSARNHNHNSASPNAVLNHAHKEAVFSGVPGLETEVRKLANELADIRKAIKDISGTTTAVESDEKKRYPRWLGHLREKLIDNEINALVADKMIEETLEAAPAEALSDFEATLAAFQRTVTSNVEARGSIKGEQAPRILALAGPTGVGKTTTLAKLAANANLLDKQQVGLISADTYRIAAIDQLRTFAGILDIPLKVIFSPAELREALNDYSSMDRIFIDTVGRSPTHDERLEELRELMSAHEDLACHLVVSATTRPKDMELICDRFRPSGFSRFIITKIDETTSLGPVLSMIYNEGLPASYLTNGQNVPDDIVLGEENDLLNLILRRSLS